MKVVIIPARGGSKGIPKKNLKKINGITLVRRALLTSLESQADCVILSTDDELIANEAKGLDIILHNRSEMNSMDNASSESVISEVINSVGTSWSNGTLIAMVQVTSPFTTSQLINECFKIASKGFASFTAVESHKLIWKETSKGWQPVNHPATVRIRRQDMEKEVYETGAVYAFELEAFKVSGYRFCSPPMPVLENSIISIDIDTPMDLLLVELISSQSGLASLLRSER